MQINTANSYSQLFWHSTPVHFFKMQCENWVLWCTSLQDDNSGWVDGGPSKAITAISGVIRQDEDRKSGSDALIEMG